MKENDLRLHFNMSSDCRYVNNICSFGWCNVSPNLNNMLKESFCYHSVFVCKLCFTSHLMANTHNVHLLIVLFTANLISFCIRVHAAACLLMRMRTGQPAGLTERVCALLVCTLIIWWSWFVYVNVLLISLKIIWWPFPSGIQFYFSIRLM